MSFNQINTSIIRDNEPDEDFRLQTRRQFVKLKSIEVFESETRDVTSGQYYLN